MKKRILSAILVLAMVLSMAPAVVTAAPVETAQSPKAGTHAATGHTCESEGCGTTTWQPWPTNGTIPTSGHYYLTQNVQLTGQLGLSNKNLHICLNGYVMTAKANTRLGWLYGTSKLVITDCTAYEEDGVYYAGAMTSGVDKVTSTGGGGAFYVYANATLELHDGKLTNCSSITGGGAIYNNGIVKLYGGELSGNVAASGTAAKHGGAIFNNAGGVLTAENVRFHDNHADNGEGGAFQNWGNATFTGCTFTGNNAATGGAMNLGGTNKTVLIDGCTFTGNTAGVVSAINNKIATGSITIKDTEITGNSNTGGFGAVNVLGSAKAVILQGKVIITDNTTGEDTPNNLHVQDGDTEGVDISGLTAGSAIGVHLRGSRPNFSTSNETNNASFFTADAADKIVTLDANNRLQLETYVAPKHSHCVCGTKGCTDHAQVAYQDWTDATALPDSGNWCLATDVAITAEVSVSSELNLCLNGHKVTGTTGSLRFYSTPNNATAVLNITDCTAKTEEGIYTAGGFYNNTHSNSTGGAFHIRTGSTLNFYQGIIADCVAANGGGGIFNNGTTNIYGGLFKGNLALSGTDAKDGGAIFNNSAGVLYVENAIFQGNQAQYGNGGAIRSWGNVTIKNSTFTENYAATSGALAPAGTDKVFLVEGCSFEGNKANTASVISVSTGVEVTIQDSVITGNRNEGGFGAVNVVAAAKPVKLVGKVIITGNTKGEAVPSNLHLQNGEANGYDVSGLTEGSQIGVSLQQNRVEADRMYFTTASESNNSAYFTADESNYKVTLNSENKLWLQYNYTHVHCVCGKTDCTDETHEKLECRPWTDATKLPANGNYYLDTDVTVSARTRLENSKLQLCLNGHTIQVGEQGGRVYYMTTGSKLVLTDCQDSGLLTGATTAAILSDRSGTDMQLDLYAGTLSGNHSATTGGALVIQGGCVFNMYGGTISENTAITTVTTDETGTKSYKTANAGGVYVGSGAVFNMYGGQICNNEAIAVDTKGGMGGGLQLAYGAQANLMGGKISGNKAYNGGGIYLTGEGTVLNLLGTEISDNSATNGGGIISQTKSVINLSAGKITGNKSSANGGGIYVSIDTVLNVAGGEISGNEGNYGGGIYVLSADAIFTGGSVTGNNAKGGGGGMHASVVTSRNRPSVIKVGEGVLFSGNQAAATGGGISASGEGTVFILNGGTISNNSAKNGGGVVVQSKATMLLQSGKITENKSESGGGGGYISTNSKLVMSGGSVSGNTVSKGHGGGFYAYRATTQFSGGTISDNTSVSGAGLKITGGTMTITNLTVSGNKAAGKYTYNASTGENKYTKGDGAGLYISAAGYTENGVKHNEVPVANISNIYLANNTATGASGGLLLVSAGTKLTMTGGTITGNVSESEGGAGYISTGAEATISGVTFSGNRATSNAGGLFFRDCLATLSNVKFTENYSGKSGAALIISGRTANVTLANAEFSDNHTDGSGVVVTKNYSTIAMTDIVVCNNTAAISGSGLYFMNPSTCSVIGAEIYNNEAGRDSGGLFLGLNTTLILENATIRDNIANSVCGGGIYTCGRLEMKNVQVLNNKAINGYGGGIASSKGGSILLGPDVGVRAENCVISGNSADLIGGGIKADVHCPLYLTDCEITNNTAGQEGGAIHSKGRMGLTNVTITGNTSGGAGYAVYLMPSEFDGHSYQTGHKFIGGNTIIRDNAGGDMYMDENTVLAITGETLGENAQITLTFHSGMLGQYVMGVYNYEGSGQTYVLTAGNRSITEPCIPEPEVTEPEETAEPTENTATPEESDNTMLYLGVGAITAVVLLAAVLVVITKKKKAAKAKSN